MVSRSRTIHPQSPPLTIGGTVLKKSNGLDIFGATLDFKMSFRSIFSLFPWVSFLRLGIFRKSWRVFHNRSLVGRWFLGFVLVVLEYCSAMWCSAADTHLKLVDRVVSGSRLLTGGVFECDIAHRRSVEVLCMLYKIRCNHCTLIFVQYQCRICQCG